MPVPQGLSAEKKAWHTEWASLPEVVDPVIVTDCAKLKAQVSHFSSTFGLHFGF